MVCVGFCLHVMPTKLLASAQVRDRVTLVPGILASEARVLINSNHLFPQSRDLRTGGFLKECLGAPEMNNRI